LINFEASECMMLLAWVFGLTVIKEMPQNVDTRLKLASLLCDSGKLNDAIALLIPPDSGSLRTS